MKRAKRLVIKVGSAVVANTEGASTIFERLAVELRLLKDSGIEAVVVSSGAIALGMSRLGLAARPASIPERQAVAAVGQGSLMSNYDAAFGRNGQVAAQVLLTHDDLADRQRFLNARNTLTTLLRLSIVPVINENDTVATEELKFGDNDALSALVTNLVEADLLVILTDIDGLYDKDPKKDASATKLRLVEDVDSLKLDSASAAAGRLGTGGIVTKVEAARKAAHYGVPTVIANGLTGGIVSKIMACEDVGTLFLSKAKEDRLTSRKHWIAFSTRPVGKVFVDDGARDALLHKGKSLLPSGIKDVEGQFEAGDVVLCVDMRGTEFARGVVNYSSQEIRRIKGIKTGEVEAVLGYKVFDEVIHRDNLVVV
ncbi:MAG: glutamate 5-kinase [Deltaproteobacteria bacterium RIFCSPLOWO2_02_FULL_53_8]|nr:MAG: glutamate 5-kinase [Deltaproteobacteria bacterium RIFCSPLOWO2_02_FULL_53_8]